MTWQTMPAVIQLRNMARRFGVTRTLGKMLPDRGYEAAFDEGLLAAIQPGDVLWDVGANVGYYTKRFAEAVGPDGQVFAFEPFPDSVTRLRTAVEAYPHVTVLSIGLGAEAAVARMQVGGDDLGATNRIATDGDGVDVEISTGDAVLATDRATAPNVVKIDTEGYELDVVQGMAGLLANPSLRAVFVEVHFGLLAERGMDTAPGELERRLRSHGFDVQWLDASHVAGRRS